MKKIKIEVLSEPAAVPVVKEESNVDDDEDYFAVEWDQPCAVDATPVKREESSRSLLQLVTRNCVVRVPVCICWTVSPVVGLLALQFQRFPFIFVAENVSVDGCVGRSQQFAANVETM